MNFIRCDVMALGRNKPVLPQCKDCFIKIVIDEMDNFDNNTLLACYVVEVT